MGLELTRIFAEMDSVPFRDEVWPKFLRDNAAKVLGIAVPDAPCETLRPPRTWKDFVTLDLMNVHCCNTSNSG
jgi:hypothetical protein